MEYILHPFSFIFPGINRCRAVDVTFIPPFSWGRRWIDVPNEYHLFCCVPPNRGIRAVWVISFFRYERFVYGFGKLGQIKNRNRICRWKQTAVPPWWYPHKYRLSTHSNIRCWKVFVALLRVTLYCIGVAFSLEKRHPYGYISSLGKGQGLPLWLLE